MVVGPRLAVVFGWLHVGNKGTCPMAHAAKTYVIQVFAGREEHARSLIERLADPDVVQEVFIPQWQKRMTCRGGGARFEAKPLTPGYLYVVTSDVDEVAQQLRDVPTFTRLLGGDAGFVPLTDDELAWMNALTRPGYRSVEISHAVKEGDRVRVVDGPLMGFEAHIVKTNAHKRLAWIEFPIMGRAKVVKVGLEVVRNAI